MVDRLSCCAPFCRRTIGRDKLAPNHNEWLCQKHWPLVPRSLKRRKKQVERRLERIKSMWDGNEAGQARIESTGRYLKYCWTLQRAYQATYEAWERCKAAAIEAAAGI